MKNNTRLARIKHQSLGEIFGTTDSYSEFCEYHCPKDENGDAIEHVQSNPDSLPEGTSYFGDPQPTRAQLLMGEAVEHLQGRQREVYLLVMREGFSLDQAGKKLGISKWTARDYKDRAIKFITQYCQRHMGKHENA